MQQRIATIIEEYDAQGEHRTGTPVDAHSAQWLAGRMAQVGAQPVLDEFAFRRLRIKQARLRVAALDIEGVPLFDCLHTGPAGITGSLGPLGSAADIGIVMAQPLPGQLEDRERKAAAQAIDTARKQARHQAIVLASDASLPATGVATVNAPAFLQPYGPPVLQIARQHWPALQEAGARHAQATLVVDCDYVAATTCNVGAHIAGSDPSLAPLVVMTPRSGWWACAAERGGGIAAFLEILRALLAAPPARTVLFTANTGHELGHIGLDHWLEQHPGMLRGAHAWLHLGANFAARHGGRIHLQYSTEEFRALVRGHCQRLGIAPAAETPCGTRPAGEARNIFDGGGQYVSIVGSNDLFHHPADRYPDAVDLPLTTDWTAMLVAVAIDLARGRA